MPNDRSGGKLAEEVGEDREYQENMKDVKVIGDPTAVHSIAGEGEEATAGDAYVARNDKPQRERISKKPKTKKDPYPEEDQ